MNSFHVISEYCLSENEDNKYQSVIKRPETDLRYLNKYSDLIFLNIFIKAKPLQIQKMDSSIRALIDKYRSYELSKVIDYDKFNRYAITHHSTSIEGSTLTEIDTRLLLDEGLTPKGKPLEHSLMTKDHYEALVFIVQKAKDNSPITVELIRQINALTMKSTGSIYHTVLGEIDSSKGEFRKGNVSAGSRYFVNYDKVVPLMDKLVDAVNRELMEGNKEIEILETSFIAHFDLVSIHPFYDGNGRTSRLLMNLIQARYNLPLAIVFKEDKASYYDALENTRIKEDKNVFLNFMYGQYEKHLSTEIQKYESIKQDGNSSKSKGEGYSFVF